MKQTTTKKLYKLKNILIIAFCAATAASGIMNYLSNKSEHLDVIIDYAQEEPILENETILNPVSTNEEISAATSPNPKININIADSIELQLLKGIGPSKSLGIIAYREEYGSFTTIEEIKEVKGIGEATFLKIKDFITVE